MRKAVEQKTVVLESHHDDDLSRTVFDSDAVITQMLKDGWEYHGTPVYILESCWINPKKQPCQIMVRYEDLP